MRHVTTRLMTGSLMLLVASGLIEPSAAALAARQPASADGQGPQFLLASTLVSEPAQTDARRTPTLDRQLSLDLRDVPLKQALAEISRQGELDLAYADDIVPADRRVTLRAERITVADALTQVLADTDLDVVFTQDGRATLVQRPPPAERPQTSTLHGTVTMPDGGAAPGTTVTAAGPARKTTQTDAEGAYTVTDLPPGRYTLTFERSGLAPAEREVTVSAEGESRINVTLELREFEEDIVVVGSRLGSTPTESALPVKILDREQIDRSGASTIGQALSLLPEVSVNSNGDSKGLVAFSVGDDSFSMNSAAVQLRGLPLGTTLVLVNGRRVGSSSAFANFGSESFFDLSNIPLSLVERIEVLPYGASAVYGGEGLAGVVNIVLKRDAQGLDVRLRNGMASGYDETQASVTWGQAWSRGSLTATTSYVNSGTLRISERALTRTWDFRRFGGQDRRLSAVGNPGTVYSLDGCPPTELEQGFCSVPFEERGNLPGLNAPFAGIPAGQDGQGLTPVDFAATAGIQNLGTNAQRLFSASETTSISIQGRYEIGRRLELFGDLLYSKRDVPPNEAALTLFGQFGGTTSIVSAENPFNPFGVDVGVDVQQASTGVFADFQPELLKPQLGIRGEWGDWTWELVGSLSKDLTDVILIQGDDDALQAALASPDPATALNVFRGDGGSFGSQELIESIFSPSSPRDFRSDLWQGNGIVRGPLAKLPAGPVETLFGVEWERQELEFIPEPDDPESTLNVSGTDENRAAFAEIRLPLFARSGGHSGGQTGSPSRELLALTGAFRVDESDRFEETGTTETVGLELRPVPSLLLRGTYSSAFKPLSPFSAFQATDVLPFVFVIDPRMGGQFAIVEFVFGGFGGASVPPDLKPETSTSRTVGLVWAAESLPGLNLSVTAWENRLRNRIMAGDPQFFVDNEDSFPERVIRDPQTGVLTRVDARPINVALTNIEGIDLGLSWRWPTRYGEFSPALAATWTGKHDEQPTPTSPVEDRLAVVNSASWAPRWKGTATLGWGFEDQVQATLIGRYVSAYQDSRPLVTGPAAGTIQTLGDFWMFDLNVDLGVGRWLAPGTGRLSDTRFAIGAVNLFNRLPDFCNGCSSAFSPIAYDATQYDIRGRFAYAELRFGF